MTNSPGSTPVYFFLVRIKNRTEPWTNFRSDFVNSDHYSTQSINNIQEHKEQETILLYHQ